MSREVKLAALKLASTSGLSAAFRRSGWRQQRLLILCYHGISIANEHEWDRQLFMPPSLLRQRFESLRQSRCNVLPLDEAVERLYAGDLPPKSVVLTFDDGGYDFLVNVAPMLQEFGFPAASYIATYYSAFNRPVFDPALSYILWSSRGATLELPEVLSEPVELTDETYGHIADQIVGYTWRTGLSGRDKDTLLADVARRVGFDYEGLCAKRLFHLMTADEARLAAKAGASIELHTHRHRVFDDRERFQREITDNRAHIAPMRAGEARHFCYPGGFNLPEFPQWLREIGVVSATTCKPGLATAADSRFLLPRVIDTCNLTQLEFDCWVSGLAALVPQRAHSMPGGQLIRAEPAGPAEAATSVP